MSVSAIIRTPHSYSNPAAMVIEHFSLGTTKDIAERLRAAGKARYLGLANDPPKERKSFTTPRSMGIMLLFLAGMILRSAGSVLGNILIGGVVVWLLIAVLLEFKRE